VDPRRPSVHVQREKKKHRRGVGEKTGNDIKKKQGKAGNWRKQPLNTAFRATVIDAATAKKATHSGEESKKKKGKMRDKEHGDFTRCRESVIGEVQKSWVAQTHKKTRSFPGGEPKEHEKKLNRRERNEKKKKQNAT